MDKAPLQTPLRDREQNMLIKSPSWSTWFTKLWDTIEGTYCNMWFYSLGTGLTLNLPLIDTYYPVPAGLSDGETRNMVFQNTKEIRLLIEGDYMITWSASLSPLTPNQEIEFAPMVNGVAITSMAAHTLIATANKPESLAGCGMINLKQGDIITMAALNHTSAGSGVTIDHLHFCIHRMG